jgi:hypothetical protein
MSSATMGVLLRNADETMTGTIIRTWAQNTLEAWPSTRVMRMSRPWEWGSKAERGGMAWAAWSGAGLGCAG